MRKFKKEETSLKGLYKIFYFKADDNRGSLIKDFSDEDFKKMGIKFNLKENFYTISKKGVVRANHFQIRKPQAKIIRVLKGKIIDVVVDLRKKSNTYMKWESFEMDENSDFELYIPEGFSHGYIVLEDSIVSYKTNQKFIQEYDTGIIWNDEDLNIDWKTELVENIILSEKDKNLQTFKEFNLKNKF